MHTTMPCGFPLIAFRRETWHDKNGDYSDKINDGIEFGLCVPVSRGETQTGKRAFSSAQKPIQIEGNLP